MIKNISNIKRGLEFQVLVRKDWVWGGIQVAYGRKVLYNILNIDELKNYYLNTFEPEQELKARAFIDCEEFGNVSIDFNIKTEYDLINFVNIKQIISFDTVEVEAGVEGIRGNVYQITNNEMENYIDFIRSIYDKSVELFIDNKSIGFGTKERDTLIEGDNLIEKNNDNKNYSIEV